MAAVMAPFLVIPPEDAGPADLHFIMVLLNLRIILQLSISCARHPDILKVQYGGSGFPTS